MEPSGIGTSELIAIASLMVALGALGVAVWQGYLQRRHYELSSQPSVEIYFGSNSTIGVALWLKNVGLGPARVIELFAHDGSNRYDLMDRTELEQFVRAIVPDVGGVKQISIARLDVGSMIGCADEIKIIQTAACMDLPALAAAADVGNVTVVVRFQSLYSKILTTEYKGTSLKPPSWHT